MVLSWGFPGEGRWGSPEEVTGVRLARKGDWFGGLAGGGYAERSGGGVGWVVCGCPGKAAGLGVPVPGESG